MPYKIVEKLNPLAVHGIFDNIDRAKLHLEQVVPKYVERGFYMDKTLTADSFTIITSEVK